MKVLAIIDMQKDFIDGALGTKEAVAIRRSRRGSRRRGRTARRSSLRATRITQTIY